jgi:hypothetical protein
VHRSLGVSRIFDLKLNGEHVLHNPATSSSDLRIGEITLVEVEPESLSKK